MPSPIGHFAAAYAVHQGIGGRFSKVESGIHFSARRLLLVTFVLSMLPDLSSIVGLVRGELARFHNRWEHSLLVGFAAAALVALAVQWLRRSGFGRWFALTLICFELHVMMDYFTVGRGVMLFWPITTTRFGSPIKLFYGLHWSDGWWTPRHIWTVFTELGFLLLVGLVVLGAQRARSGLFASFEGQTNAADRGE